MNELAEAAAERTLSRVVARYGRLDLLCLDEFGYVHLDPRGAELLFQVLAAGYPRDRGRAEREERASVAVSSPPPSPAGSASVNWRTPTSTWVMRRAGRTWATSC